MKPTFSNLVGAKGGTIGVTISPPRSGGGGLTDRTRVRCPRRRGRHAHAWRRRRQRCGNVGAIHRGTRLLRNRDRRRNVGGERTV